MKVPLFYRKRRRTLGKGELNKDSFNKADRKGWLSFVFSISALLISFLTLYFQFFYENYFLSVTILGSCSTVDSLVSANVIFHNKGTKQVEIS